ncbi:hypothetical protein CAPTEDRAFT_173011 [Capitella teleta]|uniref:Methyltransferase domain-containing protein n=1 Tax=Capitella teleta TaxID=283909 RepID=R7V5B1_CAPTE|nr:hypothetical protein CAPTEDRAFT_173011 [Capitella teleta]|eukprot:ELU14053.1 hypothetical protein CAPTEDRAFT_173011 [Capitella teleta]
MEIYIEGSSSDGRLRCPLKSAIVAYFIEFCDLSICELFTIDSTQETLFTVNCLKAKDTALVPSEVHNCLSPCLISSEKLLIHAGLCSILRKIVKISEQHELLGRKGICLKACAEVSVWTKFCEIDFPNTITSLLAGGWSEEAMKDLMKFENHLRDPPIVANAAKHRRAALKRGDSGGDLEHLFAEGIAFTLTDIVLFVCWSYLLVKSDRLKEYPLTRVLSWYQRVAAMPRIRSTCEKCGVPITNVTDMIPCTEMSSFAKDFEHLNVRYLLHCWSFNQKLIDLFLFWQDNGISVPWNDLPLALHPSEGELPASRTERKCQQLENLASVIVSMATDSDIIVDFCAGGGHLGLLVAYLLPQCKVILVENKEESIERGVSRVQKLGLKNVLLYQTNLDYFRGSFTIGTCLHACGVATDLVLNSCLSQRASFVICPCCYGAIYDTHTVTYPRSSQSQLSYEEYLSLCHSADSYNKSNKSIAKNCMEVIDSDRLQCKEASGYFVRLCTLEPSSCSPKNNLLIGRLSS